ncbi:MAG: universal stress protein [Dehalococcoidales bacterium]
MFKRLLVPLDGSTLAEIALPYAEEIARHFGSEIILVNVRTPTENLDKPEHRTYLTRMAAEVEQNIKKSKDIPAGEKVKVTSAIVGSPGMLTHPAEHILDYAEQENINLIVMSTHGRTGIRRWTLGSTANQVARAFQCPLLLIRASAGIPKNVHFGNILVPIDGSIQSEVVLPYIEFFASKLKTKINLLNVVELQYHLYPYSEPIAYYGAAGVVKVPYTEDEMKPMKEVAEEYTKSVNDKLTKASVKTSYEVKIGSPGEEIIKTEEKMHPDVVAMSTHGHSGFGRFDHGSVTDKVLHAGITPLLLVRPKKED